MTDVNEAPAPDAPGITLGDMATMVQIIDLCSKRGAFEGQELSVGGALRTNLVNFVEANKPAEEAAPSGQVPAAEEDSKEESKLVSGAAAPLNFEKDIL